MELVVSRSQAVRELNQSLTRCMKEPVIDCTIKSVIDFILAGKNCLTYRYILATALTAKATNDMVDILSLQASDNSTGAYDARSLCSQVVFPFQRCFLYDILDGSNEDPLVNNPARHQRLQKSNKSANGDPRKALDLLCDYLPNVTDSVEARVCLDYFISRCLENAEVKKNQVEFFSGAILTSSIFSTRIFMDKLLDKNFGGAALLLAATSVFGVLYPSKNGFKVNPHPVNQSGSSRKQMSDLDILKEDGTPVLAIELKDKPFTEAEVSKAAKSAFDCKAPSMLFIAGRASALTEEAYRYFNDTKAEYEDKGMVVGVITIDALLDLFYATHYDMDTSEIFQLLDQTMETAHVRPEVMQWVYRNIGNL